MSDGISDGISGFSEPPPKPMLSDLTAKEIVALVHLIMVAENSSHVALFRGPDDKMTTLEHLPGIKTLAEKINEAGNRDDVKRYLEENYD